MDIRTSSLPTWNQCGGLWAVTGPMRWQIEKAGYELRRLGSMHVAAPIGTAVHAIGATYSQDRLDGVIRPPKELIDIGMASLREAVREHDEIQYDQVVRHYGDAQAQVGRMGEALVRYLATLVPFAAESESVIAISDRNRLIGHIDLVALEGAVDLALHDFKTCGRDVAPAAQVGGYSIQKRTEGFNIRKIVVDKIQRVPLTKPQPEVVPLVLDQGACERYAAATIQRIQDSCTAFEVTQEPESFPMNPIGFHCSEFRCPAWGTQFCRVHATTGE